MGAQDNRGPQPNIAEQGMGEVPAGLGGEAGSQPLPWWSWSPHAKLLMSLGPCQL